MNMLDNRAMRAKREIVLRYEAPGMYHKVQGGKHISEMKAGMRFKASDGRLYQVVAHRTNRLTGGLREYDLSARCLEDNHIYVFHCPVKKDMWFQC